MIPALFVGLTLGLAWWLLIRPMTPEQTWEWVCRDVW